MNTGITRRADILSTAIKSGQLSEECLIDQAMTFLAAGHETTESSIIWSIHILAMYPQIQEELRDEILQTVPARDLSKTLTSEDLNHLPFLKAVCNETLRMFPPVRLTMREASKKTMIKNLPIPKGTTIMIPILAINMDSSLWGADVAEFNPYRWLTRRDCGGWEVNNG